MICILIFDTSHVHNTSGHHVESMIDDNNGEVFELAKIVEAKPSEPEVASTIPNASVSLCASGLGVLQFSLRAETNAYIQCVKHVY